ncbi:MAG: ATP-dependent zinc protease [Spongiibacteraceae bacterium]|jgi:hypothetical protein|nr:ATP-dependent zinc protease [Spongiibacteraceae bacterium]
MSDAVPTLPLANIDAPTVVGWREWAYLPELHLEPIRAKVDTGAKTCALHAFYVEPFMKAEQPWVRFGMHPVAKRNDIVVHCEAPLADHRPVTDSGGHRELRYVIVTPIRLGSRLFSAEITLTDRESMQYRMLLGRNALSGFLVDPTRSYCLGRYRRSAKRNDRA